MRAYLWTTSAVFALVTGMHVWRAVVERGGESHEPWFIVLTMFTAALCIWGARLARTARA